MKLKAALEYASRSFAVFPAKPHGKTPLASLAPHGFKDATKDPELIKKWWGAQPDANVAIATGEVSGIFVLDIDIKNDAGGIESLLALEKEHGDIGDTVTSKTWSGGMHAFFKYEKGRKSGAGYRPGIDIRGDGGYVIAPPSTVEGGSYQWECDKELGTIDIAKAPRWVVNLQRLSTLKSGDGPVNEDITANRNDELMHRGMTLRGAGLGFDAILKHLADINVARCKPPLSNNEVSTIAKSVSTYKEHKHQDALTEFWASEEFIRENKDQIVYCDKLSGWHTWAQKRWVLDETFGVERMAKNTIRQIYKKALLSGDKAFKKFAVGLQQEQKLGKILKLSRSVEGFSVSEDAFNRGDHFNLDNGTFHFGSGEGVGLSAHNKLDYITKISPVKYEAGARCDGWLKFLDDIFSGDKELIAFVKRACGYSMSESMKEQCLFILWGTGANGKSTFLRHLSKVMGDYGMNAPAQILVEKKNEGGVPNDIARLKDVRFVTCLETKKNKYLDEAQVKSLTGGDIISARFLHREFFDFLPKFKIWFATNHKPQVSGMDTGIWRRLKAIPFLQSFEGRKDIGLDARIEAEYSGVLNWLLEGNQEWRENGLGDCAAVREHTEEYKEESDVIEAFMADCLVTDPEGSISVSDLMELAKDWRKKVEGRYVGRNEMGDYLKMKGFEKRKSSTGTRVWMWFGLTKRFEKALVGDWSDNKVSNIINENIPF